MWGRPHQRKVCRAGLVRRVIFPLPISHIVTSRCIRLLQTTCLALDQLFKSLPALSGGPAPEFATSMFVGNTDLATSAAPLSMSQKVGSKAKL